MKTLWRNGTIYTPQGVLENGEILADEHGKIVRVSRSDTAVQDQADVQTNDIIVKDLRGRIVLPGLVDIHVHGGGGYSMMTGKREDLQGMSRFHAEHGTTSLLATTDTDAEEVIIRALVNVREAVESDAASSWDGADLLGAHLEGPFLNVLRAGAQKKEHLLAPEVQRIETLLTAAGGHIRLVTIAPELAGGMDAVRYFAERGITVSIGHSDAKFDEVVDAVTRGATHTTHHFNGMRPLHHREPGVAGAGLVLPELTTELIADGIHVHPAVVKLLFTVKPIDRICVITDAVHCAGLPDGHYGQVVMKNGEIYLPDGSSLAGSSLTMLQALHNVVKFTELPLERVLPAFTRVPARQARADDRKGSLETGKDADFIVIDADYKLFATVVKGRAVVEN